MGGTSSVEGVRDRLGVLWTVLGREGNLGGRQSTVEFVQGSVLPVSVTVMLNLFISQSCFNPDLFF